MMDSCVAKCIFRLGIPLVFLGLFLAFVGIANIKPDFLEKINSDFIKMVQFKDKDDTKDVYIRGDQTYIEPSAFDSKP